MDSDNKMNSRTGRTVAAFKQALVDNLYFTLGTAVQSASHNDVYMTLAHTVRDHLIERWRKTTEAHFEANPKFAYYLSMEYLMGKQLAQNMLYTDTTDLARQALAEYNLKLEDYIDLDVEPGLGNGGLGRLAACFLDSLATIDIPALGYGIRYEFGIFKQTFKDGWQVESPDEWLYQGNPWEFAQSDDMVEVQFGGQTERYADTNGNRCVRWIPGEKVLGEPYITLVPGYRTNKVNILRLWRARASEEFDFQLFDISDYARAVEQKTRSENISKVLYPNDNTPQGKELRLKQQYFFVACSLRDIIRRFQLKNSDWNMFPEKVVIQLNDTHPIVAIPELMRILVDEHHLAWDKAWDITQRTFAYTCHTLLPEALEKWPVSLFEHLLPRHLEIIYEINHRFLDEVGMRFPDEPDRVARMSLIEEKQEGQVRMANLASVGSFSINGVAELQSKLLRESTLRDFADMWPQKFNNKTNGVTPRRFMRLANPRLAKLITEKIGDGWLNDLTQLQELEAYVDDENFRRAWRDVKQRNKQDLADYIMQNTGTKIDPQSIFDILVKRLHEYKRQLLKVLHIIALHQRIKADPNIEIVPYTFIFGAKAAPGYHMAKLIIKLINSVAEVVNNDPDVKDRLKVVFLPNFNVSMAEKIYPAADISEQISMAGKEASGTGNMKFALNGALTTGTLDGANIEIREAVGADNFFLFGLDAEGVEQLKKDYRPNEFIAADEDLSTVLAMLETGLFDQGEAGIFDSICHAIRNPHDPWMTAADFRSFVDTQAQVGQEFKDHSNWARKSILNTASSGYFSSDRTIKEYASEIWKLRNV